MLRLFAKRAHLAPHPFIRKPLESRRFLMATGNVYNLSKVEQIQEAVSEAKPKHPIPGGDHLANSIDKAPAGDHLIHPEIDFRRMEGNIIKAIRDLSSKTDINIANNGRELISQMVKIRQELGSEMAQNRRVLESGMARTQVELNSEIARC